MSGGRLRTLELALRLAPVVLAFSRDDSKYRRNRGRLGSADERRMRRNAGRAVAAFIELGPFFVKLGQVLSVRPDVLPDPYIAEFSKLQDEVPPEDFERVRPLIEGELGGRLEDLFEEFDPEPISGASLSQVYRAKYRGEDVVVKVQRPGVEERVREDAAALRSLLRYFGWLLDPSIRFSLASALDQVESTVYEELDFRREASNMEALGPRLSRRGVIVPRVHREVSTARVLVMDYVPGIKVTDVERLDAAGVDRRRLANRLERIFMEMVLSGEAFHADPHPGNIAVTPEGRLVLYDFGMVGRLDRRTRLSLVRLYSAVMEGDPDRALEALTDLGAVQPGADRRALRRAMELMLEEARGEALDAQSEVGELLRVAGRAIHGFPFRLPRELVLYVRMIIVLEGVCKRLDPEFRFLPVLSSIIREEGLESEMYREEIRRRIRRLVRSIEDALELPTLIKERLNEDGGGRAGGGGCLLPGALAGAGAAGMAAWSLDPGAAPALLAIAAAALAFGLAYCAARRRCAPVP
jgi:predicted unusual protein kinase regulating ubiquinone biosynthesis (AarF/ABC1/UbiB family)